MLYGVSTVKLWEGILIRKGQNQSTPSNLKLLEVITRGGKATAKLQEEKFEELKLFKIDRVPVDGDDWSWHIEM